MEIPQKVGISWSFCWNVDAFGLDFDGFWMVLLEFSWDFVGMLMVCDLILNDWNFTGFVGMLMVVVGDCLLKKTWDLMGSFGWNMGI